MKYKYNENFFEKIDSNEKAYWLGFIMADGYIMNNSEKNNRSDCNGLRIRLCENDKSHLEKLNKDIESNKPIKIVKNYGKYENNKDLAEFSLYSIKLVNDLKKIGFSSGNKSCNEFLPKFNNNILIKNFILGLFDGDGSISIYDSWSERDSKYRKLAEWQIVSSEKILVEIKVKKFQN